MLYISYFHNKEREAHGNNRLMDRILSRSGLEERFIKSRIEALEKPRSPKQVQRLNTHLRLALRHGILLAITGLSFRELALRLADSHLFQWFVHTGKIDAVRPVSKSTLERFEKSFDADELAGLIHDLNRAVSDAAGVHKNSSTVRPPFVWMKFLPTPLA